MADGLVTPVAPGEAKITVYSVSNPEITEFCSVSVISTAVSVTGISISASSMAMQVGDLRKLSCTVQPSDATNQDVKWSSGDESVAYVDGNGEVVAMGNGSTTIQVRTDDGGITAYCSVKVTQSYFELESTVNKKNYIYDFVDMGFSSKTCWSNKNLYAVRPAENGARFAWANPYPDMYPFTWDSYIWGNGGSKQLTRYNWDSSYGTVDGNKTMLNDDNPVYFIVGSAYPCDTPTAAQFQELIDNTTRVPATIDGHSGMLFKSKKKDRAIFIPASGTIIGEYPSMEGMSGGAWSKELSDSNPTMARALSFYTDTQECAVTSTSRFFGIPIRAVYNRP